MNIEIKILNKEFYKTGNMLLSNPPKIEYKLPNYVTPGSAAIDLVCCEDVILYPGETKMIPTGIAIHIGSHTDKLMKSFRPHWNYVGIIAPRSGLGTKGLILANTIGIIDSDYQGELMVSAWNRLESDPDVDWDKADADEFGIWIDEFIEHNLIELKAGDRFAQLMFVPVAQLGLTVVDEFSNCTSRGTGGFGSTG